jgi:hypothetical protein
VREVSQGQPANTELPNQSLARRRVRTSLARSYKTEFILRLEIHYSNLLLLRPVMGGNFLVEIEI